MVRPAISAQAGVSAVTIGPGGRHREGLGERVDDRHVVKLRAQRPSKAIERVRFTLTAQRMADFTSADLEAGRMHGGLALKPPVEFPPCCWINLGCHIERVAGGKFLDSPSSTTISPALITYRGKETSAPCRHQEHKS